MTWNADDVVEALSDAGVRLDRGLTEADLNRIEKRFGFGFGDRHRAVLRAALPVGDSWLNWRHATPANVRHRLDGPVDGVVLDVLNNAFWPASWGGRPAGDAAAERVARQHLAEVPVLVPVFGRRFVAAAPHSGGGPVFSVQQATVVVFADNLLQHVSREFGPPQPQPPTGAGPPAAGADRVPFWSDLAEGARNAEL